MSKKNPFKILPLDVESFLLSTAHMSNAAVGAYARILFKGWLDEWPVGTFPTDDDALSELAQADKKEWEVLKGQVFRRFRRRGDSARMVQERLKMTYEQVKEKTEVRSDQASKAGKASAEARAQRKLNVRSTDVEKISTESNHKTKPNQIELNQTKPNQTKGPLVREVLKWAEVGGGWKRCATIEGLTPFGVLIAAEKNKAGGGKAGALVNNLTNGYTPIQLVAPELLAKYCHRGRVASICGIEVHSDGASSNVAYSNTEIVIATGEGDKRIHQSELFADRIEVRLDRPI